MKAPSAKPLFRAIAGKGRARQAEALPIDLPTAQRPDGARRDLDFYPTGQPEAIRALLARDGARIRDLFAVWEPAVGDGALAREIRLHGVSVFASDIVDRGYPGTTVRNFYDFDQVPAPAIITNPPFSEISARDGHGRWLRHTLSLPGWSYCALLLSWDWPAARANGLAALLDANPFSWCYLMRWKLDFTGQGSPPQRNAWFVWDRDHPRATDGTKPHPEFRWLDREDSRQISLL